MTPTSKATNAKRRIFFVYLLIDDRTGSPFYVGKSHYIEGKLRNSRLSGHLHDARDGSRNRVHVDIRAIWQAGGTVSMRRVFESHSERKVLQYEKRLIATIGLHNLSNNTPGGDGFAFCTGKTSPDSWTKHRKERAPFSKQWLKRIRDGQKRKWQQVAPEARARWIQAAAEGIRRYWKGATKAQRRYQARYMQAFWSDPQKRAKTLAKMSRNRKGKLPEHLRQFWSDPTQKAKAIAKLRRTMRALYRQPKRRTELLTRARKGGQGSKRFWKRMSPQERTDFARSRWEHTDAENKRRSVTAMKEGYKRYAANPQNLERTARKISKARLRNFRSIRTR